MERQRGFAAGWARWVLILALTGQAASVAGHGLHISFAKSELTERAFKGKVVFNKLDFQDAVGRWNDGIPLLDLPTDERKGLTLRYLKRHLKATVNGDRDLKLEIVEGGEGAQTIWFQFRIGSRDRLVESRTSGPVQRFSRSE